MNFAHCRFCATPLRETFCDLGMSPLSNAYIQPDRLLHMEPFYPLHAQICEQCLLVQLPEFESPGHIFSDYAYFSSYSESWLAHSKAFASQMVSRLRLDSRHQVIELACNDGYLLQYFQEQDISVLGVEPAANVAEVARAKGIPCRVQFFGTDTAAQMVAAGQMADLLIGNNVLAHVPDLNDFVCGMKMVLKRDGLITMEFPHLLQLIANNQFDTIYHEHFSYFSLHVANQVFARHGLLIVDVEELPTHGGSLRIHARHADSSCEVAQSVKAVLEREQAAGLRTLQAYRAFSRQVQQVKQDLLAFLIEQKRLGKQVVGYGAPAKGNTLLNYCGIRTDLLDYTVDLSPHKQGLFLPGVHIPVYAPERIRQTHPDFVLILPWNLKDEIIRQMADIRAWGGQFVVAIPRLAIL